MAFVEAVSTAFPDNVITQRDARHTCGELWAGDAALLRLLRVFESGVETRHFAFPKEYYLQDRPFEERNRDWIEKATDLAEEAARRCLASAGVEPREIDDLVLVTTTGLATPSVDALLVPRLGLRRDVRRWPLFGLGCAGGAGALIRADEILRGAPKGRVLVISVELCGQVWRRRTPTPTDVVGTALFADGAAAALVSGNDAARRGPRIVATRTELFDGTRDIMGWRFGGDGMTLVLSRDVTELVEGRLGPVVDCVLSSLGMTLGDVDRLVFHPGGRKIIDTYRDALGVPEEKLRFTRGSLARNGNLSSASVLAILADVVADGPRPGETGLVVALGPGFATEILVLAW